MTTQEFIESFPIDQSAKTVTIDPVDLGKATIRLINIPEGVTLELVDETTVSITRVPPLTEALEVRFAVDEDED